MDVIQLMFQKTRETKGTWRYDEEVDELGEAMIGALYLRKAAVRELGAPTRLVVSIEAA